MPQPKHREIREWIEAEIRRGSYSEGDKLPTEQELMKRFGVSRNPVEKAMTALVEAGVVVRKRGSGTVVASAGLRSNLLRHLDPGLTGPEEHGTHRVLEVRVASAEVFDLGRGRLPDGTPSACLTRVKDDSDGRTLALERCVIDLGAAQNVLDRDLEQLTTVAYYNEIGLHVRRATTVLDAVHLGEKDAAALGVATDTPVIRQLRRVFVASDRPIEVAEFFMHPHHVTLEVSQIDSA